MPAAALSMPRDCAAPASKAAKPRRRQPWKPTDFDELVFRWIKFEGMTQCWVAQQMRISQSTVSRVVQRYERWQAHAQQRERGQLDHAERLRAQFWMTYERNEQILASALRIAGEMERFAEVSKSTTRRPQHEPANQKEISTQTAMVDRSGVAARFLRLAFRVNMEQLKLVEREPLPPLAPLSADEHEELECDAEWQAREAQEAHEEEKAQNEEPAAGSQVEAGQSNALSYEEKDQEPAADLNPESRSVNAADELNVHNLHKGSEPESAASAEEAGTCDKTPVRKKSRRYARIVPRTRRPRGDDSTDELRVIGADEEAAPCEPALSPP